MDDKQPQDKRASDYEKRGLAADLINAGLTGLAAGAGSALGNKLGQGKNPPPEKKSE